MNIEWTYCKDRLPTIGKRVLFCADGFVGEGYIDARGEWYRFIDYPLNLVLKAKVDKWMPIPKG